MTKIILITGSTDGIGLETAKMIASQGHQVLLHGRNSTKLEAVKQSILEMGGHAEIYTADLSQMENVESLAKAVAEDHASLDVLINNAGVYRTSKTLTPDGLDVRFVVNAIAPYFLTQRLLPMMNSSGRVINLSSAAQSPVDVDAFVGKLPLSDSTAYAQSKLALTMWSRNLARSLGKEGPAIIAVNPGSLLGSKMVKEAYGITGGDIKIGAEILTRAALTDEFATVSGQYFDNDQGRFASPHVDALDQHKCEEIVSLIETVLADLTEKP